MRASDVLPARYKGGALLRRWSLVGGYPRCVLAPLVVATSSAEEIADAETRAQSIHDAVSAAELHEADGGDADDATLALVARRAAAPPADVPIMAVLDDAGRVVAILAGDDALTPPEGADTATVGHGARIGGTVTDGVYAPPPNVEPVPEAVTLLQARAALLGAGMLDDAEAAVASSAPLVRQAWEYASEVRRLSDMVVTLAAQIGLSPAQVDDLFRQAAEVSV